MICCRGFSICGSPVILEFRDVRDDLPDVDVHGAGHDAAPAAHAGDGIEVVHVVFELVHQALAPALFLARAGVVPRGLPREEREHARVPVADPHTIVTLDLVADVKTVAGGAHVRAGPAGQALAGDRVPEGVFEAYVQDG